VKTEFWQWSKHQLPDVLPVNGCWGCSAEFKAVLEGRQGQYFILNCLQLIDAVLPEQSSGPLLKMSEYGFLGFDHSIDDLCVASALFAGRHLWRGRMQGLYSGYYFVSDALMKALKATGLKGMQPWRVREA
jgi:hypothetical protein